MPSPIARARRQRFPAVADTSKPEGGSKRNGFDPFSFDPSGSFAQVSSQAVVGRPPYLTVIPPEARNLSVTPLPE